MCNYNKKRHVFLLLMVNCLLKDTSEGIVNILQLKRYTQKATYQFVLILPFAPNLFNLAILVKIV